jgi:uncharacterized protein YjbI with pentapeptide repeats
LVVKRAFPASAEGFDLWGSALGLESPTPPKGVPRRTAAGPRHHFSAQAVAAKADDLPKFAEKADDLEAIKKAVDDAGAVGGGLWLSYLFVLFYLAVAAGAETHADLFFENPVKLPFLNIELPLLAFFFLAPILFLIVHAYTLVHLVMLTDKAKRFDQALRNQIGDAAGLLDEELKRRKDLRDGLRRQLPSNIFIQFLAGPSDIRENAFGWALRAIAWITLVIAPVLLLLMMQIQFLPYHSLFIAWTQRIALLADLVLLWWLWGKILSGRETEGRDPIAVLAAVEIALLLSFGALLFSWTAVTFPGEWQERFLVSSDAPAGWQYLHEWVFNSTVDPATRRRWLPFSSTLVLTGLNIYEGLGIDDPKKAEWRDFVFRARGRDLKGAIFDFASLPKVDFEHAQLQGATLKDARLQGTRLDFVQLQGASLPGAQLQGASLRGAQLQGASLDGAQLQNGFFDNAQLQGASLSNALLLGASLNFAGLEGASLAGARLQGASLWGARLQGASFYYAYLQGASLNNAQLQGAFLVGAHLQGASLFQARLQGASLDYAELQGAFLVAAQLQGASLQRTNMRSTDLSNALLWRTNRAAPLIGSVPELAAVRLPDSPDLRLPGGSAQWLPVWREEGGEVDPMFPGMRPGTLPRGFAWWLPDWREQLGVFNPWDDKAYQDLRRTIEPLPPGSLRDDALDRIRLLDCSNADTTLASCDPAVAPPNEAARWRKSLEDARVDDLAYAKALAATLKTLICSDRDDAVYALRGLLAFRGLSLALFPFLGNRLAEAGPEAPALVDFIMSKDCPVSASLTDADKANLLRIKQEAIKKQGD